jgi:putative ABC transport system permease protein
MLYFTLTIVALVVLAFLALLPFFFLFLFAEICLRVLGFLAPAKFGLMVMKNLRRNKLRTSLTYVATFVLVLVITMVWSVLYWIDQWSEEKSKNVLGIVTEKWQQDSRLPFSYALPLSEGAASSRRPGDIRPIDSMTWQMYIGTTDAAKKTPESQVVLIALEPRKMLTMMGDLLDYLNVEQGRREQKLEGERLAELRAAVEKMEHNRRAVILGPACLARIRKQAGDHFSVTGLSHEGIDLELEVAGSLPRAGVYADLGFMNRDYLNDALDVYPSTHAGMKHPLAPRRLTLVFLKAADAMALDRLAAQIESSGLFVDPAVKTESLSVAVLGALAPFRDMLWGIRWLLSPAILITMAVVIANAISLNVRERRTEVAVLKVLGYRPLQILALVVGEALVVGMASGLISAGLIYVCVNWLVERVDLGGITVPEAALWWGTLSGAVTALAGSLWPALSACRIKVAEVFARGG